LLTLAREASVGTAYCYEVRGRLQLEEDEAAASQDFSRAIALHLAGGNVDLARALSHYFLPAAEAAYRTAGTRQSEQAPESETGFGH